MSRIAEIDTKPINRFVSFYLGFMVFYSIAFISAFIYNVDLGKLDKLWWGYFVVVGFEWSLFCLLLIALARRPVGKTGRLLHKLCHNDIYWMSLTSVVLIAYTLVSVFVWM